MKKFEITGEMKKEKFVKKINAETEKRAIEKTFALIGSAHKIKQREMKIIEVKEVKE